MSLIRGTQHSNILSCSVSADNTYSGFVSWSSLLQDVTSKPPASARASLAKSKKKCSGILVLILTFDLCLKKPLTY